MMKPIAQRYQAPFLKTEILFRPSQEERERKLIPTGGDERSWHPSTLIIDPYMAEGWAYANVGTEEDIDFLKVRYMTKSGTWTLNENFEEFDKFMRKVMIDHIEELKVEIKQVQDIEEMEREKTENT